MTALLPLRNRLLSLEVFTTQVSVFRSATDTQPHNTDIATFIASEKYREKIINIRKIENKPERDALKKTLPAATISGTFQKRSVAGIDTYNGIMCMDFDAGDNPNYSAEQMKQKLAMVKEVFFASLSVSGKGVFALIKCDITHPEQHSEASAILVDLFKHIDLVADRSCKDVSRLRFISWDDNPYIASAVHPFHASKYVLVKQSRNDTYKPRPYIIQESKTASHNTEKKVRDYIAAIESGCNDVTSNYEDWLKIGFALASEFGSYGEDYFHRISQFHPKYDQAATAKKFAECLRSGTRVKIGSFFSICNQNGIRL